MTSKMRMLPQFSRKATGTIKRTSYLSQHNKCSTQDFRIYDYKQYGTASRQAQNWCGAQWLGGRVHDSRPRDRGFEPHRRYCVVSLSKTHLSLLSTGSTQEEPFHYNCMIVDWDVKIQIKQKKTGVLGATWLCER